MIASQNVGLAESWSSQAEASIINNADLKTPGGGTVKLQKTWIPILDSRTRPAHVAADLQQVDVNESFRVGGESLLMPRDPNGSPANIMNCRCISQHSIKVI